jgi:hypothetical protein
MKLWLFRLIGKRTLQLADKRLRDIEYTRISAIQQTALHAALWGLHPQRNRASHSEISRSKSILKVCAAASVCYEVLEVLTIQHLILVVVT